MQKSTIQFEEMDSIDSITQTRSDFVVMNNRAVASDAGQVQVKTRSKLSIPNLKIAESSRTNAKESSQMSARAKKKLDLIVNTKSHEERSEADREKSVLKMVESAKLKSRVSKRRDSTGDLGQVKETDEDDTIWIKISDEEMVSRYGIGAIFGGEMG